MRNGNKVRVDIMSDKKETFKARQLAEEKYFELMQLEKEQDELIHKIVLNKMTIQRLRKELKIDRN